MKLGFASILCGVLAPVALLLGVLARRDIAAQPGRYSNPGQALVGLALGAIGTALVAAMVVTFIVLKPPPGGAEASQPSGPMRSEPSSTARTAAGDEPVPAMTDPAACPKGRTVIDTNTGKAIECTGPSGAASPAWLLSLARIVRDPKGAKPSAVDKTDPNEVNYGFALPPFSEAILTVFDRDATRWDLALKSTSIGAADLSAKRAPTRLCGMGLAEWYAIEEGDGPLGGAFASVAAPDTSGSISILVVSPKRAAAEKARDEAKGTAPTRSVRESLCR